MHFHLPCSNGTLAGLIAILLFSYYVLKRHKVAKHKTAPKAKGAWPIIGHLPQLGGPQLPHITLGAMADKYGPIFTIRLGVHPALVVSTWEMVKDLFTTNDLAVSSRPKMAAANHLGYNYAMFAFAPYGPYWREMRKIISLELLSNRRLELLKHVQVSELETSFIELHKLWRVKKNDLGHVLLEMKKWFGDITLNVILRMIAGKRCVGDDKEARRCQKAMREFFHLIGQFVMRDYVPFLGWLDVGGHEKAMKKTWKELDSLVGELLAEHKRERASGEDKDFMDVMLSVLQGTNFAGYDADTIHKATSLNIIAGASDTTMVTITWALSLLLNNRHALKKAQEELDLQVGKERLVSPSDISKLIYLQAIIKETLRLYPPAPLSGPRQSSEDCTVGGYYVPKGTRLIVNLWKIQRDPRMWQEPLKFMPERFLTTHKDIDVRGQHFELAPFGSGRRACPGTSLGLQIVHFALARFLHAFDISTPSNAPVDMTESAGLTNIKATPLEVLVSPRLPPRIYE